jgi:hypothetical protein
MKTILLTTIRLYKKLVSPYIPRSCRYHPTCSEYAEQAITRFGPVKGTARAVWRVLRCNPFAGGGYDPVEKGPENT